MKKYLIACSGGPDSMALLDLFRRSHKVKAVLHVNYNFRNDSYIDYRIVRKYCRKYHLRILSYHVNKNIYLDKKNIKNFENWARNIRYNFFRYIGNILNCKNIAMAHHKDDFIETALLELKNNKNKFFYGIRKNNCINNLNIYRPFLYKYWKKDLVNYCKKRKIKYAIDKTNFDVKYSRNAIRTLFINKMELKNKIYSYINKLNNNLKDIYDKNHILFKKWKEEKFSLNFFDNLAISNKSNIIRIFLFKNNISNISYHKVELIIDFLNNRLNFKRLRISKNKFLAKINNKVLIKLTNLL